MASNVFLKAQFQAGSLSRHLAATSNEVIIWTAGYQSCSTSPYW